MIRLIKKDGECTIYYNELPVVNHSRENPFIAVGTGRASYKMHHGNFNIEDQLEEKVPLKEYEVLAEQPDLVVVRWARDRAAAVTVEFQEKKGRLHLIITEKTKGLNRVWLRLAAAPGEKIYGCGEQFSELNLRGKRVPLWVSEQGVGRNKKDIVAFQADVTANGGGDWYTTYYPQPTFVSSSNYFCHVEDSHYMEFDFRNPDYHELMIWSVPKLIVVSRQDSAVALLEDLTDYLSRQPELPDWAYDGVWLGLQGGTGIVLNKLAKAQEYGVKVVALWCQDWEGKRITAFGKQLMWDWRYHKEMYPNLPDTVAGLYEKGIRFMGYINPFLALEGELYKEASARGYLVMNKNGEEYHIVITTFPAAMVDLTNPAAVEWIKDVIKKNMIDIGLSGWMADYGEYTPTDAVLFSGESAEAIHNQWPALWARVNREAVEEAGKLREVVFFTRAGYSGTPRYSTLMWAGDQLVNWSLDDGLASVIPAALSLGLSGFGLSHSDIGGYTSHFGVVRTKELFIRWAEQAAFTPVMRTHEGNRPDDCWQFDSDEETLRHFARMIDIHIHLKPYLKNAVKENAAKGLPVMRHPYIHYENDQALHQYKYQYLLGRDLLVAPVYEEGKTSGQVYLPSDRWVNLWSGREFGGGLFEVEAPMGKPPVFYRKDSSFRDLFEKIRSL